MTKYLASLRCTLHLIVSLMAIFATGFILPQKSLLGKELYLKWRASRPLLANIDDALRLTEIYTAPLTLAVWGLFFLNLALVMRQRVPLIIKKTAAAGANTPHPRDAGYPFAGTVQLSEESQARLPGLVAAAGYRFQGSPDRFYAVRNRLSPLATLLFHFSFFLMLLGGVVAFYSRFSGFVDLSVGEPFHGELARYNASPRLPKAGGPPDVSFTVESIRPESIQGVATGIEVALRDAGGEHLVEINRPYKRNHASVLFNDLGVAPLFVIQDGAGREVDGAYVKLHVLQGNQDGFTMLGYRITALFYPDHVTDNGADRTRSEEFRNPAFHLAVVNESGFPVASGTVHQGEAVEFDGYRLIFREQSFWVRLLVVKEYGLELVFAGFACATIALAWRLLYYRRELIGAVEVEDGQRLLYLAGRAEFYKSTARDDVEKLAAALSSSPSTGNVAPGAVTEGASR